MSDLSTTPKFEPAQRIAALHGLEIVYDAGAHGDAVRAPALA